MHATIMYKHCLFVAFSLACTLDNNSPTSLKFVVGCVNLCLLYYRLNMDEGACGEFTTDSMVRGHHVYQEVWTPITGEYLVCGKTLAVA